MNLTLKMKLKKTLFDEVTIVGVGLIGGSLGLAIKKNKLAKTIVAVGHRKSSIQKAIKKGAINKGTLSLQLGVKQADLVILATPVRQILKFLKVLSSYLKPGCILIDVGSTKGEIVKAAGKFLSKENPFIGCHPMAGSEKRGIETAKADLFKGAVCIITPTRKSNKTALRKVKLFWRGIGSKVELLSPDRHDLLLSVLSHLPHLAAVGLVLKLARLKEKENRWLKLIGPGFKDTTRIAGSSALIWQDICFSNRSNIIRSIEGFREILKKIESCLENNRKKDFLKYLEKAKKWRTKISP